MKRSHDQVVFDLTKRGWSFCSVLTLTEKYKRLRVVADKLAPDDPRHKLMTLIQQRIQEKWNA